MIVFDSAVNLGKERAKSLLAEAKGWEDYLLLRIEKYLSYRKKYPQFIFGWLNRVIDLWRTAREIES